MSLKLAILMLQYYSRVNGTQPVYGKLFYDFIPRLTVLWRNLVGLDL